MVVLSPLRRMQDFASDDEHLIRNGEGTAGNPIWIGGEDAVTSVAPAASAPGWIILFLMDNNFNKGGGADRNGLSVCPQRGI